MKRRVTYSTAVANVSVPMGEIRPLSSNQVSTTHTVDYCGNVIYEGGNLSKILTEEGYITLSGSTPTYHYYLKDHQGNNRVVTYWNGSKWFVEQVNHYYPFGGVFLEGTAVSNQAYKYNGKELDRMHGLDWYDYGARMYDVALGRFTTMDPMAEKYYSTSPYVYCINNPIRLIDPNGMDIYRYDSKSGKFTLEVSNNDDFDQVGRFKLDKGTGEYTLMTNKKGTPKTMIDKIEKHILSDGINFKENNNVIAVGGEGQASVEGVEKFVVQLSDMVGKEIGGAYFAKDGAGTTTHMSIGLYKNNGLKETNSNGHAAWVRMYPHSNLDKSLTGFFTHILAMEILVLLIEHDLLIKTYILEIKISKLILIYNFIY